MTYQECITEDAAIARVRAALADGPRTARYLRERLCGDDFPDAMLYRVLYRMEVRGFAAQDDTTPVRWRLVERVR